MKQKINLGVAVDTGTGDYLRRGGKKINANFDDIYNTLGNGQELQPANLGIIKHDTGIHGTVLNAKLGMIYAIDTSQNSCTVNLPLVSDTEIGKSLIFIDPYGTWNLNPVTFMAQGGSSFGSTETEYTVAMRYSKTQMTYINPATWLFNPGQRLDQFNDIAEASRYVRYRRIEVDGQTDFTNIFPVKYNDSAIDVIVNGVDLYHGESLTEQSEFGSIDPADDDGLVPLNGFNIRLRYPLQKGDIVKFVTYLKSTGTSPTSVEDWSVKLLANGSSGPEVEGEIIKMDLSGDFVDITLADMGGSAVDEMNNDATNIYVNGKKLIRRGSAGFTTGECTLSEYLDPDSCLIGGGTWNDVWREYELLTDDDSRLTIIRISTDVLNVDPNEPNYITVETFNYILGTISDLQTIINETDLRYLRATDAIQRKNKISYTDIANPTNETAKPVPGSETTKLDTLNKLLETMYPVGSLYFNAHNKANPRDFMGFGTWQRYAQGRALVGWDGRTDALGRYDDDFGLNSNDLDETGRRMPSAGNTIGSKTSSIKPENLPIISAAGRWLKKAVGVAGFFKNYGDLGGSNVNPISSYNEERIEVGKEEPDEVNNIQPSITVYCWVRVQ